MIGWYAHHHGLGHVSRLQAVAAHLDVPVTGLSSLPAPEGWCGPWVRLARDDAAAVAPGGPTDQTANGTLHWVPRHDPGLAERAAQVADWVTRTRPGLVVVDVSVEVALTVRLCGVPVVVVTLPGRRTDPPHRLAHDLADALLAPWPEGAHSRDWPESWVGKLAAVGGISRFDGRTPDCRGSGGLGRPPRVLVVWGGGGRQTSPAQVEAARAATPGWEWVERSPASPSRDLWADLARADVVVTHGGQNAVAEVAAARRPAVVVAQPRPFDEQEATATAVDRLGMAVGLPAWPTDPDEWPGLLARARAIGGSHWQHWSSGHGAATAAAVLESLVRKLSTPTPTPTSTPAPTPGSAAEAVAVS